MKKIAALRHSLAVSIGLWMLLFALPLAMVKPISPRAAAEEPGKTEEISAEEPKQPEGSAAAPAPETLLQVLNDGTVEEMPLEKYLVGVVRAEMPASFEPEALKAQAVAARTYTLYKIQSGGNHGESADICTDSTCCQAYLSEEAARANWGEAADANETKIEEAVRATAGEAILYGGAPVLAVFHSASAGLTRAAGEVWQSDLPYLRPVDSPEANAGIPNYYSRSEISAEEFRKRFLEAYPAANLSGPAETWLSGAVTDSAGSVDTVRVGGVTVRGTVLRSLLGLRSACFTWEVQDGRFVFFVTGFGHGVGMSQCGANQMAREGATYREILTHYYTGVTVAPYVLTGA